MKKNTHLPTEKIEKKTKKKSSTTASLATMCVYYFASTMEEIAKYCDSKKDTLDLPSYLFADKDEDFTYRLENYLKLTQSQLTPPKPSYISLTTLGVIVVLLSLNILTSHYPKNVRFQETQQHIARPENLVIINTLEERALLIPLHNWYKKSYNTQLTFDEFHLLLQGTPYENLLELISNAQLLTQNNHATQETTTVR